MKTIDLVITLLDDCIFSERNATEGAHQALDYIPGGALLGAAAARLYADLGSQCAFDWFHSGKMRFGNAYPLTTDGQQTFPMPACWHEAKNKSAIEDGEIVPAKVWRLDKCEKNALPDNQQPKQLRAGYLALSGLLAETHKSFRMKTAIDAETGRAKEGVLFGYDALRAGQRFYAQVSCDDAISDADLIRLKTIFSQPLLLGRSRSAEYGRATVEIIGAQPVLPSDTTSRHEVTFWLLSDLMALDEYGQPTLSPAPQQLGLPEGKLAAEKSFLRTRRYSTWNAYKQGYEMERQVISKGSVLVYELDTPLTDDHLKMIAAGLGVERQAGLGQVWLNPPLLANEQPELVTAASIVSMPITLKAPEKKPDLIAWLEAQKNHQTSSSDFAKQAKEIARSYKALMRSARELKGLDASVHVGPSHSQWGAVLAAAKSRGDLDKLFTATDGSFKAQGPGWKDEFWSKEAEQSVSFYSWFSGEYNQRQNPQFIGQLVREIMSVLKNNKGGHS